jgi:hypothetical protein
MMSSKVIFILYVCYYRICECQGLCRTQHAPRLSEQSILNSCGRHMVHHRERQDRGERTVRGEHRRRVSLDHLDVRIPHALSQRRRQPRVDLDGGEASGPLAENIGDEAGAQLENVFAGIHPVERPRITQRSTVHLHSADRQTRRCSRFIARRRRSRRRSAAPSATCSGANETLPYPGRTARAGRSSRCRYSGRRLL